MTRQPYFLRDLFATIVPRDRALGSIIGGFGRPGHMAGDFTFLHSVLLDSQGNLYTGETIGGRRVQILAAGPAFAAKTKDLPSLRHYYMKPGA